MIPIFISSWHAQVYSQVSWHRVGEKRAGVPGVPLQYLGASLRETERGFASASAWGAAGAEASRPRGPSSGSPRPPPGLSSSLRCHHRCSSRLCRCRRSLDRLLFPWLRPAWQLVGCQARGGGRGRGETGREEGGGRGREGRGGKRPPTFSSARGPSLPGYRLPKRRAAGVEGGRLRTRCREAERRPRYSFRGAGMKLSGKELGVGACHSQLGSGAPPRGKYW